MTERRKYEKSYPNISQPKSPQQIDKKKDEVDKKIYKLNVKLNEDVIP